MIDWKEVWQRKGETITRDVNWLDAWDETIPIDIEHVADEITKHLEIGPKDKVLDVGCGAGALAKYIAPICKQYIGIDYTPSLVDKHIKILHNSVLLSEANDIPFKDNYFDKSFSFSIFQYFPNKTYSKEVLKEMKRVTKGPIFIGDIPFKSHRKEHLLYNSQEFPNSISFKGYWNPDRFNVLIGDKK